MSTTTTAATEETLFGHPKGLYILFFTEMWERFSYYGMRALLVLYMIAKTDKGGFGWDKSEAIQLYGWYTMFVYVASVPGGLIADRLLGQKKCVLLGGLLLCVGHIVMAIEGLTPFYTALVLIVLGVGLLKPNISTMVGGLYAAGDARRDKGFSIFYMGINIGALASALIVGYIGETYSYHYGFGLAGVGMILGQIVFMYGQKYLRQVGNLMPRTQSKSTASDTAPLTKIERDRVVVLLISFLIVLVFWGAFEQAGGLMNIYTKEKVDRVVAGIELPASTFQSLNPFFIILFATAVGGYWYRRTLRGKESSAIFKMAVGTIIMGLGFVFMVLAAREGAPQQAVGVDVRTAVINAGPPTPETTFWQMAQDARTAAEQVEEVNGSSEEEMKKAGARAVSNLASIEADRILQSRGGTGDETDQREAIHAGLIAAANMTDEESVKSNQEVAKSLKLAAEASYASAVHASTAIWWVILAYLFHTIGELCASPVAMSFITKLSPAKYASLMMGVYFAVTGFGNKLAGLIGEQVERFNEFQIFSGITIFTVVFAGVLLMFLKPLKRLTHGAEAAENLDERSQVVDEG